MLALPDLAKVLQRPKARKKAKADEVSRYTPFLPENLLSSIPAMRILMERNCTVALHYACIRAQEPPVASIDT